MHLLHPVTAPRERPILFSAPMVRAILAGTKTQTRRVVKGAPEDWSPVQPQVYAPTIVDRHGDEQPGPDAFGAGNEQGDHWIRCPYGQPGDRLWARETWGYFDPDGNGHDFDERNDDGGHGPCRVYAPEMMQEGHPLREFWRRRIAYKATWKDGRYGTGVDGPTRWRPSIHMPRWASRITLEVTDVKVERLQDISEADAMAEGITKPVGSQFWHADPHGSSLPGETPQWAYRNLWESINGPGSWEANPWIWCVSFKRLEAA